jgi:hypothetical protein
MPGLRSISVLAAVSLLTLCLVASASAQVATLRTPDPDAEPSPTPAVELESEDALLTFSECMREHGVDLPDPRFGGGSFFAGGSTAGIDLLSLEFLAAFGACQRYLAAAIPATDPEEQAERNERAVAFAECMRERGIDWPDPDPVRGMTFASMFDENGDPRFDPFDPEFQATSRDCAETTGARVPGMPSRVEP